MDKIVMWIYERKICLFLFMLIMITAILLSGCKSPDKSLNKEILNYCNTHEEIRLSNVTDFDWDIAYVDRQYYMVGEELKEKHQIEGEFKRLETDFSSRVAFCKDGKLVYDLVLNNFYFEFNSSVEVIKYNSIFTVSWVNVTDQKEKKLFLSLKE